MPKFIFTFIAVLLLGLPQLGSAQAANPCDGVLPISLRVESPANRTHTEQIQSKLDNYRNYLSGNMYKLCFAAVESPTSILQTLSFNIRTDKPVLIHGLNIKPADVGFVGGPLISIGSNAALVTLQSIHISNAMQGIALAGKYHRIIDSEIAGIRDGGVGTGIDLRAYYSEIQHTHVHGFDIQAILGVEGAVVSSDSEFNDGVQCLVIQGKSASVQNAHIHHCSDVNIFTSGLKTSIREVNLHDSPRCIIISGDEANVKSSDVHHCSDVGISIAAEKTLIGAASAETYATDKNLIHDNGVGIFIAQGQTNKFAYNSVYGNKRADADSYSPDGGLNMFPDLLAQLGRPEILLQQVDGVSYGLQCSKNEATQEVESRWIQVQNAKDGTLAIHLIDRDSQQGRDLLLTCQVDADGVCPIVFPVSAEVPAGKCGSDLLKVVAQISNDTYSTIYTQSYFVLNEPTVATAPSVGDQGIIILTPVAENGGGEAGEQPEVVAPGAGNSDSGIFVADSGPGGGGFDEEIFTADPGVEQKDKKDSVTAFGGSSGAAPAPLASGASGGCSLHHLHQSSPSILPYLFGLTALVLWSRQRKKA